MLRMKRKGIPIEELIAKAVRGELSPEEAQQWEAICAKEPELAERALVLQNMIEREANLETGFKPFFAGRVMQKLQQKKENIPTYLPVAFRWIATPVMALIIGGLIYIGISEGSVSYEAILGLEDLQVDDLLYDPVAMND